MKQISSLFKHARKYTAQHKMLPKTACTTQRKKNDDYFVLPIGASTSAQQQAPASKRRNYAASSVWGAEQPRFSTGNMYNAFFMGVTTGPEADENAAGAASADGTDAPQSNETTVPPMEGRGTEKFQVEGMTEGRKTADTQTDETGNSMQEAEPYRTGWWAWPTRKIFYYNSAAVILHGVLAIVVYSLGSAKSAKMWHLKQDRIYASLWPKDAAQTEVSTFLHVSFAFSFVLECAVT